MLGAAQVPHPERPTIEELLEWWVVDRRVLEGTVSPQGPFKTEDTGISKGTPSLGSRVPAAPPLPAWEPSRPSPGTHGCLHEQLPARGEQL